MGSFILSYCYFQEAIINLAKISVKIEKKTVRENLKIFFRSSGS